MTQSRMQEVLVLQLWGVDLHIILVRKVIYILLLLGTLKKEMKKHVLATLRQFRNWAGYRAKEENL